jgi:DNA-binding MurR/RpiR family transcriptional regulator
VSTRDLLLERFASLSPKLQVAARFVVDHPNEVVTMSMRAIAERARTQPATLVRLAQHLGFAGWPELKDGFVGDLGLHSTSYGARAKSLAGRAHDAGLVGEMFTAQQENLRTTEASNARSLRAAAKLLKKARVVHIAGFRASYPIAWSLTYGYRLFRDSVVSVDGHAGGLEMQLRAIERGDAVVAISFAPYSREARVVVETARAAGARVIAITDSGASPLALAADATVLFACESPSFFPSIAAAIAAAEALLEILVADAGAATARRIDAAEQVLFESGAYLQRPSRRHRFAS